MQTSEAARRREEWGDKPCDHGHVEKEYYLGAHTGDYVCTTCGRDFSSPSEAERDRQRQLEENPDGGESSTVM